jgi:hypothetical protein
MKERTVDSTCETPYRLTREEYRVMLLASTAQVARTPYASRLTWRVTPAFDDVTSEVNHLIENGMMVYFRGSHRPVITPAGRSAMEAYCADRLASPKNDGHKD